MGKKHASQYANFGWLPVLAITAYYFFEKKPAIDVNFVNGG